MTYDHYGSDHPFGYDDIFLSEDEDDDECGDSGGMFVPNRPRPRRPNRRTRILRQMRIATTWLCMIVFGSSVVLLAIGRQDVAAVAVLAITFSMIGLATVVYGWRVDG